MASFFKTVGDKVIFSGDGELIYYVPEKYFEVKAAETVGEKINMLGMCTYAVFDKTGKKITLKPLKCETMIQCIPSSITKESNYLLEGTKEPKAYRLLHFKNGDELICSTKVPVDIAVLEKFVDIFKGGNLPENIPYNQIQDYVLKSGEIAQVNLIDSSKVVNKVNKPHVRSKKEDARNSGSRNSKTNSKKKNTKKTNKKR